jgi:RNA polymerase sigma factor for flagellar operon FliA
VKTALSAIRTMYVCSFESLQDEGFQAAGAEQRSDERLDLARMSAKLRAALATLPEKERALVTKHYWEGKNLLEAGAELGISKSWASRLHAQAVERLRVIVDAET